MLSARILLVDSDPTSLELLQMILDRRGHSCAVAASAAVALLMCAREKFDCVFVHASLAGASGVALAERLADDRAIRPHHIILMSGHHRAEFTRQLRDGVIDGFLRKPPEVDELLAALERCITH